MSKNDDTHPVATLMARLRAENPGNRTTETVPPIDQTPQTLETPETASGSSSHSHEAPAQPDQPQAMAVSQDHDGCLPESKTVRLLEPMTDQEFHEELGVKDLPIRIQRLLFAAPVEPIHLLDRYADLHDMSSWLARFDPFIDDRLVFAAGWLSDLLVMEMALRPAQSRDELRTRIMILADSRADRPENGHYDLVCETILRADIARLGLPADDAVVTHFESRMTLKKSRKSED